MTFTQTCSDHWSNCSPDLIKIVTAPGSFEAEKNSLPPLKRKKNEKKKKNKTIEEKKKCSENGQFWLKNRSKLQFVVQNCDFPIKFMTFRSKLRFSNNLQFFKINQIFGKKCKLLEGKVRFFDL